MRRDVVASMEWSQVDLSKRFVYLPKTKNGEVRTVPLSPAALAVLQCLPRNLPGVVFAMSKDGITKAMVTACKKAEIAGMCFHDLRHEATSRLFENTDLDVMEIRTITGHKSMHMLARYSHLRMNKLSERLAGTRRGNG